jgi:transcriptional regulator with XRE-family HTH domain
MKTLDPIIAKLPAARRAKIAARAEQLIAEEVALQHLRKARRLTQKRMAQLLDIGQDSVSRIETRSDLLLSTLRNYVEAMGGSLKLVVEFPDSTAVLSSLGETGNAKAAQLASKKTSRGSRRLPMAQAND